MDQVGEPIPLQQRGDLLPGSTTSMRAEDAGSETEFGRHMAVVARARSVLRQIHRLLDEQAVAEGLQPLQHQALLQVYGAGRALPVNKVAERLDIAPALASRVVRRLEELGLVDRVRVPDDRRIIAVEASEAGVERLRRIDAGVREQVAAFRAELGGEERHDALTAFTYYLGVDLNPVLEPLEASGSAH